MTLRLETVTIDAHDPHALARWWAEALDYEVGGEEPDEIWIQPKGGANGATLLFLEVRDDKTAKNRIHLDLRPDDRDAEVARLESMGATRVDIGQTGEETWIVLADPEGNELCVLRSAE
ncbi:MAG TPA: VOC family protein [Acidimicrobiales bacterium]|jgi:hypothetical protein|nr:VOC family protein [Acidimicrobiales bacterium]